MITGELIYIDFEFQIEIQDVNYLPMSIVNMESSSISSNSSSSSQYFWLTTDWIRRMSVQVMANASINAQINENSTNSTELSIWHSNKSLNK